MAITVNGKKVAGTGPAGLSPYQVAVAGGYTGTEQEFNQQLAQLDQLFQSVSDGKSAIAAAITDKGVTTAADATFQQMAENIGEIETGGESVTITIGAVNFNYIVIYTPVNGNTCYIQNQQSGTTFNALKNSVAACVSFTAFGSAFSNDFDVSWVYSENGIDISYAIFSNDGTLNFSSAGPA